MYNYLEILLLFAMTGLNCAEAVNFAPADWLPHGGFGSELYRRYHKAAVLSHDELLCVVGKVQFLTQPASSRYMFLFFLPILAS